MKEKLKEIIEQHEILVVKHEQELADRLAKMKFTKEHNFSFMLIIFDYSDLLEQLKKLRTMSLNKEDAKQRKILKMKFELEKLESTK